MAGSSGAIGAEGALTSSFSGSLGEQKRNILAVQGINDYQQRAANFRSAAERSNMFASLGFSAFQFGAARMDTSNLPFQKGK